MSDELVTWLRAQLDEDERVAQAAGGGRWHWEHGSGAMCNDKECPYGQLASEDDEVVTILMDVHGYDIHEDWEGAEHIARHDPATVLRDVEAKRRILDLTRFDAQFPDSEGGYDNACEDVIKLLAEVYAGRPGYRAEWRP